MQKQGFLTGSLGMSEKGIYKFDVEKSVPLVHYRQTACQLL